MPMAAIPMPAQTLTAAAATEPATMAAANNLCSPGRPESSVSQSEVGSCTAMAHAVNVAGHEAEEWGTHRTLRCRLMATVTATAAAKATTTSIFALWTFKLLLLIISSSFNVATLLLPVVLTVPSRLASPRLVAAVDDDVVDIMQ